MPSIFGGIVDLEFGLRLQQICPRPGTDYVTRMQHKASARFLKKLAFTFNPESPSRGESTKLPKLMPRLSPADRTEFWAAEDLSASDSGVGFGEELTFWVLGMAV